MLCKDGECPVCGRDTHGIDDEPMRCFSCGWVQGEEEAKKVVERINQALGEEFPEERQKQG